MAIEEPPGEIRDGDRAAVAAHGRAQRCHYGSMLDCADSQTSAFDEKSFP